MNFNIAHRPKIGLALGSGGARGLSIIGVLKVLEAEKIPIDCIAGSSIGAMIGGFYAAGLTVSEIEKIALNTNWKLMFSLLDPHMRDGLIGGEKVKKFIEDHLGKKTFAECRLPFAAVATDLKSGEEVVMDAGDLASAIRASISVPLVFQPVKREERVLADGGLSLPVPVSPARRLGADFVIAVNLDNYSAEKDGKLGLYDVADMSLSIVRHQLAMRDCRDADLTIAPNVSKTGWHQFLDGKDLVEAGEKAAMSLMPQLHELLHRHTGMHLDKFLKFFEG